VKVVKVEMFKEINEGEKIVIDAEYEEELQIIMVLTNNGEFGIINLNEKDKSIYIRLKDVLPYKLESLSFSSFVYQKG
jgi:hypothetical protein